MRLQVSAVLGMARRLAVLAAVVATAGVASAQTPDSAVRPLSMLRGQILNQLDSTPVRMADIRIFYIDSGRTIRGADGGDSLDVFIDTTRSRFGATDSLGRFSIPRVASGRYMIQIRRIGFAPIEGGVIIDQPLVDLALTMNPTSLLLSKVRVVEAPTDVVTAKLDKVGFIRRSRLGIAATFVRRTDVLKHRAQTIADLLARYGVHGNADISLDQMPAELDDLRYLPADLVVGIEIYRHNRPTEFNATRKPAQQALTSGGAIFATVVIWTYVP